MNRLECLRRCAVLAAGGVAVDQLELLERLSHRKVWAGHSFGEPSGISEWITPANVRWCLVPLHIPSLWWEDAKVWSHR